MTIGAVDSKIKNKNSLLRSASQTAEARPTSRRPKIVLTVPTPALKFQKVQPGVPDTQLTREATGLLHEFSTPLLFNHSHRVFFWANELGQRGRNHRLDRAHLGRRPGTTCGRTCGIPARRSSGDRRRLQLRGHVVAQSTPDARHHSDLIRRDADALHVHACGAHECPDATASMSHPRPLHRAPRP